MFLTVKDLMRELSIGRDKAYALMRSKAFPAMKIGKSGYRVSEEAFKRWQNMYEYKTFEL